MYRTGANAVDERSGTARGELLNYLTSENLDDLLIRVYERLLRGSTSPGQLATDLGATAADVTRATGSLAHLRVVQPCTETPGNFVAVSPEIAEVEVIGPLEQAIRDQFKQLSVLRGRLQLLAERFDDARRSRRRREDIVKVAATTEQARFRLADAARHCRSEVLTMQPGGAREREQLQEAAPRDLEMLARGVGMKIIYQHTARTDVPTRNYVRDVTERGAEVRTSNEIFDRMIIFDRQVAFLPRRTPSDDERGAIVLYEQTIVGLLCGLHDHIWRSAIPFDLGEVAYGETLDEVRMTILNLLAAGLKDDVIARRLGMSARTCRRHIATLMSELKAASRFQAGVAASRSGLLPADGC